MLSMLDQAKANGPVPDLNLPVPTSIVIMAPRTAISVGETVQLILTAAVSDGTTQDVTSPNLGTLYASTDPAVISVNSNGMVTGVGGGRASIFANNGSIVASLEFTVRSPTFLEENCTITILNRSVQIDPGGSFGIGNVPVQPGYFRIRVTCVSDGVTTFGQSGYFFLNPDGPTAVGPITYGEVSPMPVGLSITAPKVNLTTRGEMVQLMATATFPNGSTTNVSSPRQGTFWSSSNPDIAQVNSNGLVTALTRGLVTVQALNEGVQAAINLNVLIPNDADNDGMTDEFERANGLNPNNSSDAGQDLDGDSLTNLQEFQRGTNPRSADTDGDGLLDGQETVRGTNPLLADSDADGLNDGQEILRGSNPLSRDTDSDGIADGLEVQLGLSATNADPVTTLQGRVVDTSGAPVTNASISAFNILTANSDASGFFVMSTVPAGLGSITVVAQTIRLGQVLDGMSSPVAPVVGGMTALGVIQIGLNAGTVAGLVTDPFGGPVPGALVTVTSGADIRNATADGNGRYRISNMTAGNLLVIARDYRSGLRGRAAGVLAMNSAATLNVQLGPFGTVNGTVLAQDNVTPVGAGVSVNYAGPNSQNTSTDPLGRYSFDFTPLGGYSLNAVDTNGNRGRSGGDISATAQVNVNDIAYLGRGRVFGVVRDGANNPVNGASVTLSSGSVFGGQFVVTTDGAGRYAISNVFVGPFQISARAGQFGGAGSGAILQDSQFVTNNLMLSPSASIAGTVFRPDGLTPITNVQVTLRGVGLTRNTDTAGQYRFDALPLGGYTLDVLDPLTGDRGRGDAVLVAQGEIRTANITLNGQGSVMVTVRDGASNLVSGAQVRVTGQTQFGGSFSGVTASDGTFIFSGVFAGNFAASATDPATGFAGSSSGSVTVGGAANILVRLQSYGIIAGRVFQPDGTNPAPGITVRITGQVTRTTATGSDGTYQFTVVPTSTYNVDGLDSGGNLRARASGVALSSQGQVATQDLVLIGLGTVEGIVRDDTTNVVANLGVSLNSQAPGFGRSFFARTDINGRYSIAGVPVGPFTLSTSAQLNQKQCFGNASGAIASHQQTVARDIQLDCTVIPINPNQPAITLYDANNFSFGVRANASVQDGSPGGMYGGDFGANRGAFLLDLTVGGTNYNFTGAGFATPEDGGREIGIRQDGLGGLNVTRKVYVPGDGYFVRYLETISNPSGSPITATLKLTSHYRFISKVQGGFTIDREPRIVSTSTGDATLDILMPGARDHWVVIDDDENIDPFQVGTDLPAVVDVFEGTNGIRLASSALYSIDFGNRYGRMVQQWTNVTVPPGGSVSFLHFGAQQVDRVAAQASAARLVQLPPEALAGMSLAEMSQVQNFNVPNDGSSSLLALPQLTGTINGRTLSGDGSNVIANARVRFKSANVFFGRTYTFNAGGAGQFAFTGFVNGQGSSVAVPVDDFNLIGIHPLTGGLSVTHAGAFPAGLLSATRDVIFEDTGNLVGTVRRHSGVVASQGSVVISGGSLLNPVVLGIALNGTYRINGLPANSYTLVATTPVAQGSDLSTSVTAGIIAGQTTTANLIMPETGTITGIVRREGGAVAVNLGVSLRGSNNLTRNTITDTGGRFTFFDVPIGIVTLDAFDSFSNTAAHTQTNSVVDQSVTVNLTLIPGGSVAGFVTSPSSQPVSGAQVTLTANNGTFFGVTGPSGRYQFDAVVPGGVSVRVFDPSSTLRGLRTGNLALSGQTLTLDVQLFNSGTVTGIVYRTDGTTPVAGATVQITGSTVQSVSANASGQYIFDFVPLGSFTVTGTDPANGERGLVSSVLAANGETRRSDIVLTPNISIADASVTERNVGVTNVTFLLRLSSPSFQETRVNYITVANSASAASDFLTASGTVIFAPGVTNGSINVAIVGDVAIESSETFFVDLSSPINGTITDNRGVGTILNDDGQIGAIDHFGWVPVTSPQFINQPFPVTITAFDAFNTVVSNFVGPVNLSAASETVEVAVGGGNVPWNWPFSTFYHDARCQSIYLASEIGAARLITGLALDVTGVPGQTMNAWTIRMKHTALSGYAAGAGWDGGGWTTVQQTNLAVSSTGQLILPFSTPFSFNGVDNLLIDFSFNNGFYTGDGSTRSTDTVLTRSLYYRTDSGAGDPLSWSGTTPTPSAIARIPNVRLLGSSAVITLSPSNSGPFVDGSWTGNLLVQQLATNMILRADDGDGHTGTSSNFTVLVRDDLSVAMTDSPDPVPVGAPLTYTISVTNSGPAVANGVTVTNVLPASAGFVSATASQGACANVGGTVRCDLGMLGGGSNVVITLVVTPTVAGQLTNRVSLGRGEADPYLPNNVASVVTSVLLPGLTIDDTGVTEGNSGTKQAIFAVRLSYPSGAPITINYATSNGTAIAGIDYVSQSGQLTFPPGITTQTVSVVVIGDTAVESAETFLVNLSSPINALLLDAQGLCTITNDDGIPGELYSFAWDLISSPQFVDEPFAVTVRALDAFNNPASSFTGTVALTAFRGGGQATNTIIGSVAPDSSFTGTYTLGYSFTPNTNLLVTHFRHLMGNKVSLWTDAGQLLVSLNVSSVPGNWVETALPSPVELQAGTRYRLAFYQPNGIIYYANAVPSAFLNGVIHQIHYTTADAFPTLTTTGAIYPVDLRYVVGTQSPVSLLPPISGNFVEGVWMGNLTLQSTADALTLEASDNEGHSGRSGQFAAFYRNDLIVRVVDAPDPAPVGQNLNYFVTVTNTGPTQATGVFLTNTLPASVSFVSATVAGGSCTLNGRVVTCSIGNLPGGSGVTVSIVVIPTTPGTLVNVVSIGRAEADAFADNNTATAITSVLLPSLSVSDVTIVENNSGASDAVFNVSLSYPSLQTVSVTFSTADGSASAGSDYVSTNRFLTFPVGTTNVQMFVKVLGDLASESNETFLVNLTGSSGATLSDAQGVGTIIDDELLADAFVLATESCTPPNNSIDPGETVTVELFLRNPSPFSTGNLVATLLPNQNVLQPSGPQSYGMVVGGGEAVGRSFTFVANGACGGLINLRLQLQDGARALGFAAFNLVMGNLSPVFVENFDSVTDSNVPAGWARSPATGATIWGVTSTNLSDTAPKTAFSPEPAASVNNLLTTPSVFVATSNAQLSFRHQFDTQPNLDGGTLQISIAGGSFTDILSAGGRFIAGGYNSNATWTGNSGGFITTRVVLPPSTAGRNVQLRWRFFTDSSVSGGGWNIDTVSLDVPNCCIAPDAIDLAVAGTDSPDPVIVSGRLTYTLSVTNRGPGPATDVMAFSELPAGAAFVSATAANGCTYTNGVVTCNLGNLASNAVGSATVVLTAPETAGSAIGRLRASASQSDFNLGNNGVTIATLVNFPGMLVNDVSISEGNTGTTSAVFTVRLTGSNTQPVSVGWYTSDSSALAGFDYLGTNGVLLFAPGETNKTARVTVLGDTLNEGNETFFVNLVSPINATLSDSQGFGTILNDDALPSLSVSDAGMVERNVGVSNLVFVVSLDVLSGRSVSVNYATANGTATSGGDYGVASGTLNFAAGETSKTVVVPVYGDTQVESNETFFVNLSNPGNAALGDGQGVGTILNDDGAPGQLDHFTWSAVSPSQFVGEPFAVTLTAQDAFNVTVSNYSGMLPVRATGPGALRTNTVLGEVVHTSSGSGNFTLGYSFTPKTNLTVTHVRHYSGTKVSIWTDAGVLVASQNVSSSVGSWRETALAAPVTLVAGSRYRVAFYTGGGSYYYRSGGQVEFPDVTINQGYEIGGDAFPSSADSQFWWFVDLRYTIGTDASIGVNPAVATFNNGVWNGTLAVQAPGTNVQLIVDDGDGHQGRSSTFDAQLRNDLSVAFAGAPNPADVGSNLVYSVLVSNTGPAVASSVVVSNRLPSGLRYISSTSSLGMCSLVGDVVRCDVGDLPSGASASMTVVTVPIADGIATSSVMVARSGTEFYIDNNAATVVVTVRAPFDSFKIQGLFATGSRVVDHNSLTGDDRGGIAASSTQVLYSGDSRTARFALEDLSGGTGLNQVYDAMVGDLRSQRIYSLGNGGNVIGNSGGIVTTLLEIDGATGVLNGNVINLSTPINLSSSSREPGIFAGYGLIVLHNDSRVYSINLPTGLVRDLGALPTFNHSQTESWAYWGVAENFGGSTYLVYAFNNDIVRTRIPDGATTLVATFSDLSDMASITVSIPRNRWYFHYEGGGQFGGTFETIGYADASFNLGSGSLRDDLSVFAVAEPSQVTVGSNLVYTLTVTNTGPSAADGVRLTNVLGEGVSFISSAPSQGTCAVVGRIVSCDLGSISGGSGAQITLIGQVVAARTITNVTEVVRAGTDFYVPNNVFRTFTAVILPELTIEDASVDEGSVGQAQLIFDVRLSFPSLEPISVEFSTFSGSAEVGLDFLATNGVLIIPPGQTNGSFAVLVVGDAFDEDDESLFVELSSPTNATLANSSVFGTILNDDALPSLSVSDAGMVERNVGVSNLVFVVSLDVLSGRSVSVNYATANGTATSGGDYGVASGTLNFAAGETSKTVVVPVYGDTQVESNETFFVNLSNPGNAALGDGQGVGTILNDDGAPGQLDHFTWSAVSPSQFVGEPFAVTLTAQDAFNVTVSNYSGMLPVRATGPGALRTNTVLGEVVHTSSGSGNFTLGYSFTPKTNLTVTHVRHYSGTKVSIWTDAGVLVASQNVSSSVGSWRETALAAPVTLVAGSRYRVAFYTGGGSYYYRSGGQVEFPDVTINQGYEIGGDAFPSSADSQFWWFVDLRYTIGTDASIGVNPAVATFNNGVWNGTLAVQAPGTNVQLIVDDGDGHQGLSSTFDAQLRNDLSVASIVTPSLVDVGSNLTFGIVVSNTGPVSSTGVMLTNILSPLVQFISVASSQGSCTHDAGVVTCDLGTVSTVATISIVARVAADMTVMNTARVGRSGTDPYTSNNVSVTLTPVRGGFGFGSARRVAVYGAEGTATYRQDVRDKLVGTGLFSQVVEFNVQSGNPVPTLLELLQYDAVLVFRNNSFNDGMAMGNVLADYVDNGGGVVVAVFALDNSLSGRLRDANYLPVIPSGSSPGSSQQLIPDNPSHPILAGVSSFNGGSSGYHQSLTMANGGELIAHLSSGAPMVATKQTGPGRVVALNFFPPSSTAISGGWAANTDGARLMANALGWAGGDNVSFEDDISLSAAVLPPISVVGGTVTFTMTVTNPGPAVATGVFLTAEWPGTANFVTAVATQGDCTNNTTGIGCALGSIPPASQATVTLRIQPQLSGTFSNRVRVTRDEPDGFLPNNEVVILTSVAGPFVTIDDIAFSERNVGFSQAMFRLRLSNPSTVPVSVPFSTFAGTASPGGDYLDTNGFVVFAPGVIEQFLSVRILGDLDVEPNETIFVNLNTPTNGTLVDFQAQGLINNDDGLAGIADHFDWSVLPDPATAGQPFSASVTARDSFNNTVTGFSGPIDLQVFQGLVAANRFVLGNQQATSSGSSSLTVGYAFVPDADLIVTHVRHFFGTKVSIWKEDGTLIASQPVTSSLGSWVETPFPSPVRLRAGLRYRIGVFTGGGTYYWRNDGLNVFTNGTLLQAYAISGDAFPDSVSGVRWWLVDLRFGIQEAALFSPSILNGFVNGTWNGQIVINQPATNVFLTVEDGDGHRGDALISLVQSAGGPNPLGPLTPSESRLLIKPTRDGTQFRFTVWTTLGRRYVVEFTDSLHSPAWKRAVQFDGNGTEMEVVSPIASPQRFFRVRVEDVR